MALVYKSYNSYINRELDLKQSASAFFPGVLQYRYSYLVLVNLSLDGYTDITLNLKRNASAFVTG